MSWFQVLHNLPGKMQQLSSGRDGCRQYSGSHTGTWWTRLQVSWNCSFAPRFFLLNFSHMNLDFLLLFHFTQVSKWFNVQAVRLHLGSCAKHWDLHPCQDQCQQLKEEQGQAPWPSSYSRLWWQFAEQSLHWLSVILSDKRIKCLRKMWFGHCSLLF